MPEVRRDARHAQYVALVRPCDAGRLAGAEGPNARAFYQRFEQMIAACGTYYVAPAKTRIAFLAQVRFANITKLNESEMVCTFALPKRVRSARVVKIEEIIPAWCVHHLRVACLAAYVPARQAARLDPAHALRHE